MKKLIASILIGGALLTSAFMMGKNVEADRVTERVVTKVTMLDNDKDGFIEVTNVNNPKDTIEIEKIDGIKLGQRVRVDFDNDYVIATKIIDESGR